MPDGELLHLCEEMERHGGNLSCVLIVVANWKTADLQSTKTARIAAAHGTQHKSIHNFPGNSLIEKLFAAVTKLPPIHFYNTSTEGNSGAP
jgi:hypothetical protein